MSTSIKISQTDLKSLIHYDPLTGSFTWAVTHPKWLYRKGESAGYIDKQSGYYRLKIDGKAYQGHIMAFLYMTGDYPPKGTVIDHIDHNRSNNAWANLRNITKQENSRNVSATRLSKTGHQGVRQRGYKYIAYIKIDGKVKHLGTFGSASEAVSARKKALLALGFHANHGEES